MWKKKRKEGNVLFNDARNTFYLRLYGVGERERERERERRPLDDGRLLIVQFHTV